MPPTLTQTAAQAILARETAEVFLDCLTFEGTELGPYRFVYNPEVVERSEGDFSPMEFHVQEPEDTDQVNPTMTVQITNVGRDMVRLVKEYAHVPSVKFETVLASDPDTVQHGPFEFQVRACDADPQTVTLECGHEEDFLNQRIPYQRYDPSNSPGMWV